MLYRSSREVKNVTMALTKYSLYSKSTSTPLAWPSSELELVALLPSPSFLPSSLVSTMSCTTSWRTSYPSSLSVSTSYSYSYSTSVYTYNARAARRSFEFEGQGESSPAPTPTNPRIRHYWCYVGCSSGVCDYRRSCCTRGGEQRADSRV